MGRLELVSGATPYHVLDGKRVDADMEIELHVGMDEWIRGHYQWSGLPARWPGLRVPLAGPWANASAVERKLVPAAVLALPPEAELRWPVAQRASDGQRKMASG